MRRLILAALMAIAAPACKSEVAPLPAAKARLSLTRSADGRVEVQLAGAPDSPRAVEVELEIGGQDAFLLQDAEAPDGVPLDTVKIRMRGANRAILFAGDKRGARLNRSGAVARFRADPVNASTGARGELRIARAVVSGPDGAPIETELGGPLPIP